jgi:citrate lyase subunit beta/citryl-CoA lyase
MTEPFSYLFVPGHRPDRFAKAVASGAHRIILDLEDAVGAEAKDTARDHVDAYLSRGGPGIVRINAEDTPWWQSDIAFLARHGLTEIMVPKVEPDALRRIAAQLPGRPLIAIVETAVGLARLRETVQMPEVARLAFGNIDFGADARIPGTGPVLDPARFEIALASRLGNLPRPIDGVTVSLESTDQIAADIACARQIGFAAKLCIHPKQVAYVNGGFAATQAEIDWAHSVVAALDATAGDVVEVNGKMVDRPMLVRARQILELDKSE